MWETDERIMWEFYIFGKNWAICWEKFHLLRRFNPLCWRIHLKNSISSEIHISLAKLHPFRKIISSRKKNSIILAHISVYFAIILQFKRQFTKFISISSKKKFQELKFKKNRKTCNPFVLKLWLIQFTNKLR